MVLILCVCWRRMFLLLLTLTLGVADAGNLFYEVQQQEQMPPADGFLCPDQASKCPNTATCCQLSSGEWGCCPFARVSLSQTSRGAIAVWSSLLWAKIQGRWFRGFFHWLRLHFLYSSRLLMDSSGDLNFPLIPLCANTEHFPHNNYD